MEVTVAFIVGAVVGGVAVWKMRDKIAALLARGKSAISGGGGPGEPKD